MCFYMHGEAVNHVKRYLILIKFRCADATLHGLLRRRIEKWQKPEKKMSKFVLF